jgi:hypothetical protein
MLPKQAIIIEFENQKQQDEFLVHAKNVGIFACKRDKAILCLGFKVRQYLAELLAELFFGPWQKDFLRQLVVSRYDYFTEQEQQKLLQKTINLAQKDNFCWGLFAGLGKEQRFSQAVAEHLCYRQYLHWEGFGRFRLVGYREYLSSLLSIAADELLLEQENSDYLDILKDYLGLQQPGGEIHVFFFRQGMYDICLADAKGLIFLEGGRLAGYEDMLVFSLLHLAPQKLLLHIEKPLPRQLQVLLADIFGSNLQIEVLKAGLFQGHIPEVYH